jgi:predicted HD superfamily hydrolase involved in NAD metabolism
MAEIPLNIQERLRTLPAGLRDHIQRVREIAGGLAVRHGVDQDPVDLAAAAHDLARTMKGPDLLDEALRYGLPIHSVERTAPILLHGPVAALWLERNAGVSDLRVLDAVRWHTTGRKDMGEVARVVFLADKLDPEKVERRPFLTEVRDLARNSVDRAMLEYLNQEVALRLRRGDMVHPASLELRTQLLESME